MRVYGRVLGRLLRRRPADRTFDGVRRGGLAGRSAAFAEDLPTGEDVLFGQAAVAAGASTAMVGDAEVVWTQRANLGATARMYRRYGEGSGRSRDARLCSAATWAGWPPTRWESRSLARGGRLSRGAVVLGAAGYLTLPMARVPRERRPEGSSAPKRCPQWIKR